ncbi:PD-(D/E)XK nuclease family protein, partial [Bradyrhizobium uaiense]
GPRRGVPDGGRRPVGRSRTVGVAGQSDGLAGAPNEVLIVDFKTNHAPPTTAAEAPKGYIRQLALYRAVLAKLYPQRIIHAALLWTETPEMMEISAPALDAGLA